MSAYATLAARDLVHKAAVKSRKRRSLDAWIRSSDGLLNELELLNADDVVTVPDPIVRRLVSRHRALRRLGGDVPSPTYGTVQDAVNYTFDVLQTTAFPDEVAGVPRARRQRGGDVGRWSRRAIRSSICDRARLKVSASC